MKKKTNEKDFNESISVLKKEMAIKKLAIISGITGCIKKILIKVNTFSVMTIAFMKKKSRKRNIAIVGIIFLVVIILIPNFINRTIFHNNNSVSAATNDGAWLSFWGSYLGGIFGGIATLIGIVYTIKSSTDDKKPIVIPFRKEFFVYIDSASKNVSLLNNKSNRKEEKYIYIYNVGRENALNVDLKWIPPKKIIIDGKLDNDNMIIVPNSLDISMMSRKDDHFQVIMCSKGNENNEKIKLYVSLQFLIEEIYRKLLKENSNIIEFLSFSKIPMGILQIDFDDIYGNRESHNYEIYVESSMFFKLDLFNSVFMSFNKID